MAELKILEVKFAKDYRAAFEDLATHMFCTELGLSQGVNRRINQSGIESDPVEINSKKYAYQAKYYEANTKLVTHKNELIKSIQVARSKGVTDLMIFVNKDLPDTDRETGEEPKAIKEINEAATCTSKELPITLVWWTLSKIEQTLDMPKYQYIRELYIGTGESDSAGVSAFYDYIYGLFSNDVESKLYGGMSLLDSYIEPTLEITTEDAKSNITVRNYLETWVEGKENIAVICGEPGHGKTSLCRKAMCDFYKRGWLSGQVSNVFCFSLNPANTNALSDGSPYLYSFFSWGDDRKNQIIKKKECKNALIFLDGFDELKEWCPSLSMRDFIKNKIIPFCNDIEMQDKGKIHIVITSRTMALEPETSYYTFMNGMNVPINKLQPISAEEQLRWIENYIQWVQKSSTKEADELKKYYKEYSLLLEQPYTNSIKNIFGIPIIFRMIVTTRYHPEKNKDITEIYTDLFDITWERHKSQDDKDPLVVKSKLAGLALKMFINDNDTVETNDSISSYWLFSFYTKHDGTKRAGFLHRSFYQYFLAYEILLWYKNYAYDKKIDKFKESLSYLAQRRLDKTTLVFIQKLYNLSMDKEALRTSFDKAQEILKETDGIFLLPENKNDEDKIRIINPLLRANNIFWNIVTIGVCNSLN